jgi:hypothetical protein
MQTVQICAPHQEFDDSKPQPNKDKEGSRKGAKTQRRRKEMKER